MSLRVHVPIAAISRAALWVLIRSKWSFHLSTPKGKDHANATRSEDPTAGISGNEAHRRRRVSSRR